MTFTVGESERVDPSELTRPIDNTALSAFMECEMKYYLSMVLHRKRNYATESPALVYGTTWHKILEVHYKTDGDMEAVMNAAIDSWVDHGHHDDHRTLERAMLAYKNYVERWGPPSKEDGKTLGWPENPAVELSTNALFPGLHYPYAGKIDRIIKIAGQFFVEDHKTTSMVGSNYFSQFDLDNQMMGYSMLGWSLIGTPVVGVRINLHATYKKESKFERQIISYSKERLLDWAANLRMWLERIQEAHRLGRFTRNYKACAGKYGQCPYASVCSMPPRLRARVLESDYIVKEWNPLETENEDD